MKRIKGDPLCDRCNLCMSSQNVCIMGRGAFPAKVMVVGEAPGAQEAKTGLPFMGKAGQELERLLFRVAKLDPDQVYITNVVKCRPPGNRKPHKEEIQACSIWLEKELSKVNPTYIILLGETAINRFLGRRKVGDIVGEIISQGTKVFMPTYHPAAMFYDRKKEEQIETHFRIFGRYIRKGGFSDDLDWSVVTKFSDLEKMVKDFKGSKRIAFDIETTTLNPFDPEGKVVVVALGTQKKQWIIPFNHYQSKLASDIRYQKAISEMIADLLKDKEVIAHNGKFDSLWMLVKYGVRIDVDFDTMLGDLLLNENRPHGLKYLAALYYGAPPWDIEKEKKQGNTDLYTLARYAAYDVYWTYMLRKKIKKLLKADEDQALWRYFKYLLMPVSKMYVDVEYRGVYVDVAKIDEVDKDLTKQLEELQKKIDKYKKGLNCNSSQQVSQYLFGELKLTPIAKTKKGSFSAAEPILKQLRDEHPVIDLILEYKRLYKLRTFIRSWREHAGPDGRMHPRFKIHGTVTGRPSCEEPNLQQTPRDPLIRSLVTAPKGWSLVEADESQIELRVAAMISGDEQMKFAFQTGQDIHTLTAQSITGKQEVTKEERKRAKAVNFGFLYGMGADKFREYARDKYGVEYSKEESHRVRKRFFDRYPGLLPWHERQRKIVRALGFVRYPTGRIRHLPDIYSEDEAKRAEAERQSINSPVQGFAAEITLAAAVELWEKFRDSGIFYIVGTIHDAILMEVKSEHLAEVIPHIQKAMRSPKILKKLGVRLSVPLECEISVGAWGKGQEWKS